MERRNSNCDKCNIKLKGNGAYELHYTGKVYWLCGHCMNGIVKREIKTSEPVKDFCDEVGRGTITPKQDFVTPICEDDVVEITGKGLLQHRDVCRKEGALKELKVIWDLMEEDTTDADCLEKVTIYHNESIKELEV